MDGPCAWGSQTDITQHPASSQPTGSTLWKMLPEEHEWEATLGVGAGVRGSTGTQQEGPRGLAMLAPHQHRLPCSASMGSVVHDPLLS